MANFLQLRWVALTVSSVDSNICFAETLFNLWPTFIPTQALYLDLEGQGQGSEDILSIYWPGLLSPERFSWIKRSELSKINLVRFEKHIRSIGAAGARWIVVYSGGQEYPEEKERLVELLGKDPFPNGAWINLLHVVQQCQEIKSSIRASRNVWYGRDQSRVRYSLEALEWEFGIERPISIRGHNNRYKDLDGGSGNMEVLSTSKRSVTGEATDDENSLLRAYCEADVKNMFTISYACEQFLFSKDQRRARRKVR